MGLKPIFRITVFVPPDALRAVIDAVKKVHPLGDDHYDSVLWYSRDAMEEFRALPGADPARGRVGELHEERVVMLVFSIPRQRELLNAVVEDAIRKAHPYESPGVFVEESWMPDA